VYPETKGVPLEEMDAVFGEDERQNESETTSLIQTDSEYLQNTSRQTNNNGWFDRLFKYSRTDRYEEIEDNYFTT